LNKAVYLLAKTSKIAVVWIVYKWSPREYYRYDTLSDSFTSMAKNVTTAKHRQINLKNKQNGYNGYPVHLKPMSLT